MAIAFIYKETKHAFGKPMTYTYKGCHRTMILKFRFENEDASYILDNSDRFTIDAPFEAQVS
jgi:hypothetical protein